ncbi:hypothetical protein [Aminipila terrae]|uniref:ABC transporter permease n=1 Tax=Aminipila terrae TaxID=2697030 RepID=A0A6P1MHV2_9FIRM|nr:hypothetical protein [Aminipila terrae]QHI73311.1 hypothetical protein Ami3637_13840 [Aminipila terrae]
MIKGYGQKTEYIWYVSLFFMFSGLYMLFSQSERIKYYFGRLFPCYRKKHIIETAFIRQHDSSRKRITLIAAWLTGFSIFFGGLCGTLYPTMLQNAASYSPYDLVYSQIFGMNQAEDYKIQNLLKQNGIVVKEVKQVNYLRDRAFNMLPASQVNKEFGCNYQIDPGQFLNIFQYELDDGYNHEMIPMKQLNFNCGRENLKLKSAGSDIRILFNGNPTFADYTLVLNDTDYNKLAIDYHECWKGTIKLYAFDEWKNSGKGIQAVQRYLFQNNHIKQQEQNHYYKASSKIETFTIEKQSAQFLIFLMSFIMALFCGASSTMVYFKIKGEAEEEQRMLFGLYRIGITPEEMLNIIQYKNICYFMPQSILGICIGVFYNYTVSRIYGYQMTAVAFSLIIGFVLAAVQLAGTITYSRKELYSFGFLI